MKPETLRDARAVTLPDVSSPAHFRRIPELGIQAAEALQHAHDQGVLHRDIKPGNLLLDADGELFIADFGLARIEADAGLTMTGDLVGTLRYMPPEQAAGNRVVIDHRADVYSLGASLYELLTLEPAFGDSAHAELLKQIAFDEPPRPQKLDRRIPAELETIVLKAMAKEPEERYQSAQLMADDLRAFLDNRPIKARPASVQDRLRKWSRRHQTLVVLLALSLTALSMILAASTVWVNRARTSAVEALKESAESASLLADQLYDADVMLAYQLWEEGWSNEVPALLRRHRPEPGEVDRRGYEWHLLNSISREPRPLVLAGHNGSVNEIAVFPDGRRLASVGDDGCLRIWDANTGELLTTFDVSPAALQSVAISPDGVYVAAANETVFLCNLSKERAFKEVFRGDHNVESLAFGPDGKRLAAGFRYHEVCFLSLDGAVVDRGACDSRVESLEYLPETGQLIVPARRPVANMPDDAMGVVQLWGDDARVEQELSDSGILGSTVARPSPCGRYVAAASRYGSQVAFFSVTTGKAITTLGGYRDQTNDLAYSPDGSAVAVARRNGVIQYIRVVTDEIRSFVIDDRVRSWGSHHGSVNCVRFLGPGLIASCGADGLVKVWDLHRVDKTSAFMNAQSPVLAASLSPDGERLIVVAHTETLIVDADDGRVLFRRKQARVPPTQHRARACWSPRSDLAAMWHYGVNEVSLHKRDGQLHRVILDDVLPEEVAFSPDSRSVAIIGGERLRLVNVRQGATIVERSLPALGLTVAFAHHADMMAYGGRFGDVILASANLDRSIRSLRCVSDPTCLAFSPDDSQLASGHSDGVIRLWHVESGRLLGEIIGHDGSLSSLAFSGRGDALLSAADGSPPVRVASTVDCRSYGVVYSRAPHGAFRVMASSDGRRLAVSIPRGHPHQPDVVIWDVEPEK